MMRARDNPFSTPRIERILSFDPSLSGTTWEKIEHRWLYLNKRASLVAAKGAGKSTFLDAFQKRIVSSGNKVLRISLNQENKKLHSSQWKVLEKCQQSIVILDGEEQLSILARNHFYNITKDCSGLLTTRHYSGRLPNLISLNPDIHILTQCVERLAPSYLCILQPMLRQWWLIHDGNIREILLQCYDYLANIKPS